MKDKAIAKITEEAMAIGDPMAIAIEEHLTARCTNTQIAEKLLAEDKSLKKAIDVIMQKARKIASENRKGRHLPRQYETPVDLEQYEAGVRKRRLERYKNNIVAIGYAERQMADSLRKAGKVKVEL